MTEKLKIPNHAIESDWRDDIDVSDEDNTAQIKATKDKENDLNFETFKREATYVSPKEVSEETIKKIKARKVGFAALNIFGKTQPSD